MRISFDEEKDEMKYLQKKTKKKYTTTNII